MLRKRIPTITAKLSNGMLVNVPAKNYKAIISKMEEIIAKKKENELENEEEKVEPSNH